MASETHNVKKRNFCNHTEDHSIDLPRKRISNFTNKNMKEEEALLLPFVIGDLCPARLCISFTSFPLVPTGLCFLI
uniref:MGC142488 protein n=1 Tax=Bos taurus TaxID=9913 RepID=Q17QA6_BOVIN|nr:MGC142488 protein [Bos taurus]